MRPQVRQGKWHSATEMLGESNPFRDSGRKLSQSIQRRQTQLPRQEWTCHTECGWWHQSRGVWPCPYRNLLTRVQVEASMCHLRGLVMLKLNRSDQAKQCFLEALALDVKCYDSFEQLINGEMMSADEGE